MHLNYLPLRFTSDAFDGGTLSFPGNPKDLAAKESALSVKLRDLRQNQGKTHFFYASGNTICCLPYTPDAPLIGEKKQFTTIADFQLANALARNALFEFFKSANHTVIAHRPVTVLLEDRNLASARKDVFGIFPEYTLDVRPLAPHEGHITSGVLIGFGIRYVFLKTASELLKEGVSLEGVIAVRVLQEDAEEPTPYERRYLGRIDAVRDGMAILSDSNCPEFPLDDCYLEAARTLKLSAGRFWETTTTRSPTRFLTKPMASRARSIRSSGSTPWEPGLKRSLPCPAAPGSTFASTKRRVFSDAGYFHPFNTPDCVLRPGGSITVPWPIDKQIDKHGPYDAESFPDKRARLAVICPEEFVGEVGQFLRRFKEGVHSTDDRMPFRQGFVRKYHLNACDFSFHEVKRAATSLEEAYKAASLEALKEKPHLAVA